MRSLPTLPDNFAAALRLLRKRAQLTQEELGRAVGYSREQIARLENGSRLPDLAAVAALFVPALLLERERGLVEQFLALAGQTRRDRQITITRTKETRIQLVQEMAVAPETTRHSLPAPLLPLIGRAADVDALLTRLNSTRLITLVGAPGIGKSRLALEVGRRAAERCADGAAWIALAEAQTPADIVYAVVRGLGLTPAAHQTPAEAALAYLRPRALLLVLDNCEQLGDGVTLFTDWLAAAPRLQLLCTSRTPLDLYGEQEWPLAPLAVPDLADPRREGWEQCAALQLLVARARAADPAFAVSAETLLPLAALCVALDGLPLALELAAVRLRDLSPDQLVEQLLRLRGPGQLSSTWLQQTRRNVAERHRTLHAAIGWSVRLLPTEAHNAFLRLGVFAGGGTAEAAAAVAQADAAVLTQLARAHLIQFDGERFSLLETLRAYALEQLPNDAAAEARQAHSRAFVAFAQAVFDGLLGDAQAEWMRRATADQDNCLAALRWALAEGDGATAVAIAAGMWWFWYRRGLFGLGRELLAAALALDSADLLARARALNGLASFCVEQGDYADALACHEQGLRLRRALHDDVGVSTVLHNMGLVAFTLGDFDRARVWLEESIAACPGGDHVSAWVHLGSLAQETGDLAQARAYLEQAVTAVAEAGDGWLRAFADNYLADVLNELGERARAAELAQESVRIFAALDDRHYLPDAQVTLAQIALEQGEYETVAALTTLCEQQYAALDNLIGRYSVRLLQAEAALRQAQTALGRDRLAEATALLPALKRRLTPRQQAAHADLARRLGQGSAAACP